MKVGDYIRTKRGLICRIININEFREPCMKYGIEASYLDDIWFIGDDDIKLVKERLIDLIEVGDYVNGERVKALKGDIESHKINNEDDVIYTEYINDYDEWCGFEEDEIETIVTKEQFESMQYKVGE